MAARKSGRKRCLSLKAELNALVVEAKSSRPRVPTVTGVLTKSRVASRSETPQPATILNVTERQSESVKLSSTKTPRKRKRLSNEVQEEEEAASSGCGLYESVSEGYADLCAMFPGRLFQIGLLLRLLTGVSY